MPFKEIKVEEKIKEKAAQDTEFREAWEKSRNEYALLHEMVRIRREQNITQKELAERSDCRQQEISRFENRQHSPSLGMVLKIVDCLGYELKLVKKNKR